MDASMKIAVFGSANRNLTIPDLSISCYILSDKSRVLTKNSVQKALGYDGKSENWLRDFLLHIHKFLPLFELLDKFENSNQFLNQEAGAKSIGIDPFLFIEICQTIEIAKNDGFLSVNQLKYAKASEKILKYLSRENIIQMIDEACGFKFYKEMAIVNFSVFLTSLVSDPSFKWIRTIPEDFFEKFLAINNLDWTDLEKNPQIFGKIVHDVIFSRIPGELIAELRFEPPKRTYRRKQNLRQNNQHPRLETYIDELLLMLSTAKDNWNIFVQLLNRAHPKTTIFAKFPALPENKTAELSSFDQILKLMS